MNGQPPQDEAWLRAENIGGIDATEVRFQPGVTVLKGRNATNRTSLLQAVMAACGSDNVSIKGNVNEANVELTIGADTYTRTLTRTNGKIRTDGDRYLDDPTFADLFAFLLESNEARRAVVRGDDLRDLIMRPVDTTEIEREIENAKERRQEIDAELDELDALKRELPDLEEQRSQLCERIEARQAELEKTEAEIEDWDADVEDTREAKTELEEQLEELREKRVALDETRYELETEQERLEALEREQRELQAEYDELEETSMDELADIRGEIKQLRERKQQLETEIGELQTVIGFNEEMLETEDHEVFAAIHSDSDSETVVTDQLVEDSTATCWTCGSEVDRDQILSTVEQLRELSSEKFEKASELDDQLAELTDDEQRLEESQQRRERVERRLDEIDRKIESQEETVERLKDRRDDLQREIKEAESEVEKQEADSHDELLELHKEANQLEYEIGRLESELEDIEEEIATIETELDRESELEAEREEVKETIRELRTKIERTEQQAIEAFNDHMETLLDLLDYRNLERIWLERTEQTVRDGRQKVSKAEFELHVVRRTESGTTYEDTINHLSESEREVTGLVFALAGYLVHDVHENVPFMLLDSLEALDSERIATLIDYFSEYSHHLVVALLPEDAAALDGEYRTVRQI